jgi:outer membrane immunogenic protein
MHMTRLFLRLSLAAAALVSVSSIAMSADLLPPPPPPEELRPATYDWTGVYVGAVGALGFLDSDYEIILACGCGGDPELKGDGFLGGAVVGYNWQMDNLVFGVEGDWMWGGKQAENELANAELTMDDVATIRARIGWADDDTLIYVTGGYAVARATEEDGYFDGVNMNFQDDSNWHDGWVVGGGIEHAFWDNLHGRIEYLYAHFSKEDYDYDFAGIGGPTYTNKIGLDNFHMVRVGLTYNFAL